jgi:hypothetical protein
VSIGYSIAFSIVKDIKLVKLFFDCIGPEDSRLLVHVLDAERQTMLHLAVMAANIEVVKLLLDYGSEPGARDVCGQTPYVKLKAFKAFRGTLHGAQMEAGMILVAQKRFNIDNVDEILRLLKAKGGDAVALDDITYSTEQVEGIHSRALSAPRLGKIYNPMTITNANIQWARYLNSESPYLTKISSIEDENLIASLVNSLGIWATRRKAGLISQDELPEHWV